jgi:hypothetical protein
MEAGKIAADQSVVVSVHLASLTGQLAGVQFDVEYDALAMNVVVETGPAALSAGKVVHSAALGASKKRILIIGFNRSTMADGVVALLHVTALPGAPASTPCNIRLSSPAGTDAEGRSVVIAGSEAMLSVPIGPGGIR